MRVVVTGGAGFVGSHLVGNLLRSGHEVTVVDNLSTGRRENLPRGVSLIEMDVRSSLAPVFSAIRPEVVFHLAAQVSVPESVAKPGDDLSTNVGGAINVMEAAAQASVRKVIAMSSAAVYGIPQELPLTEESPTQPISPYGLSKLMSEKYIRMLSELRGVQYSIIRPANIFGPRQLADGEGAVIPAFMNGFMNSRSLIIHGSGEQTRDFIYVDDMVGALVQAMNKADGLTLNVSSSRRTSVLDLWTLLASMAGWRDKPVFGPSRAGDIPHSIMSNELASTHLNWRPLVTLQEGLAQTAVWYSEQQAATANENSRGD